MNITIEIPDELVTIAQNYTDLTVEKGKSVAKNAIVSLVISEATKKIREDGDADTQELVDTKIQEIINIIKD